MSQGTRHALNFVVKFRGREKRTQALLASNLPRDIPASDAPKACQALAREFPARAVFFVSALGHRCRRWDIGVMPEKMPGSGAEPQPWPEIDPRILVRMQRLTLWFIILLVPATAAGIRIGSSIYGEQNAIRAISRVGGSVVDSESPLPRWLRLTVGSRTLSVFDRARALSLSETKDTDEAAPYLSQLPCLTDLYLMESEVTDRSMPYIASLNSLRSLQLGRTAITDAGIVHVSRIKMLEHIDLWDTAITDDAMTFLCEVSTLKTLVLNHTRVTDIGLRGLTRLRELQHLDLGETAVSDSGIPMLLQLPCLNGSI